MVSSDIPATPPANQNVVVHARDQNDITVPGRIYVREKKAGVWGLWSIDGTGVIGPTPPADPPDGLLWWDSESGQLYVWYRDVDSAQWVIASPSPDPEQFLLKGGDTMEGVLNLTTDPVTTPQQAATKKYVDDQIAIVTSGIPGAPTPLPPPFAAGTSLLFYNASAPTGWVKVTAGANDQALRVVSGSGGVPHGSVPFSTVFGRTSTDGFSLSTGYMAAHGHTMCGQAGVTILDFDVAGGRDFASGGQLMALANTYSTGANGSGAAHTHTIDLRVQYLDVILCTKT